MAVIIVVGAQWGDEGKGKIIDVLSADMDMVIRYQGGANAGHTVYVGEKKYVLHLIPSGILRDGVICIVGDGVVLDPVAFCDELAVLSKAGIDYARRLFISPRAHIIFPYHKVLDAMAESKKGKKQIGTTGRGIGPAYADKYNRTGIRAIDLLDENAYISKLEDNLRQKNFMLREYYHCNTIDLDEMKAFAAEHADKLRPYIKETYTLVNDFRRSERPILLEGAQGALLDIDFGSYPYVTSSHTVSGGAFTGSALAPVGAQITGVMKAYLTRVGNGPFPTELNDEDGKTLAKKGHEFGATTGRPRRCGWLDLVAAKYSGEINGLTNIALTKIDVLQGFKTIRVCISYTVDGREITEFPADQHALKTARPNYREFPGWEEDIAGCCSRADLPQAARDYIAFIEDYLDRPVKYISVGQRRDQIIHV